MLDDRVRAQLESALAYLQRGFHLTFMADGSKGPHSAGWNTPSELVTTPTGVVQKLSAGPQNMGVCHEFSGTMALDVDNVEHTRFVFDEMGLDFDDIVGRGMRIKSKAGRDKVLFACANMPLVKIQWPTPDAQKPSDLMTVFELRSGANQDVLPPSRHPDGHFYEWWPGRAPWDFEDLPAIPDQLLQFWHALADRKSGIRDEVVSLCPWAKQRVGRVPVLRARNISRDHQDVIGKYNATHDIGDLLEGAGYKRKGRRYMAPSSSTGIPGVVVLEDRCYSHHGSDPLADGYAHDAFDLFCTFYHNGNVGDAIKAAAEELGVVRQEYPQVPMQIDIAAAMAAQARRRQAIAPVEQPEVSEGPAEAREDVQAPSIEPVVEARVPAHLLRPAGVLGTYVDWVLRTSIKPQPELALASAIALFGAVLANRVVVPSGGTGGRTNFYVVGLAKSARGKEHAVSCIHRALEDSGQMKLLMGNPASGSALRSELADQPASLWCSDEFGMMLKRIAGRNAAGHEQDIVKTVMEMSTKTGTTVLGNAYANAKDRKRKDIVCPCLNLYATTTPETFWPAIGSQDAESGFLPRLLIVSAPSAMPAVQFGATLGSTPPEIVEWIRAAVAMHDGLMGKDPQSPLVVRFGGMTEAVMRQFQQMCEDRIVEFETSDPVRSLMWSRAYEHACKLSLMAAVTRVSDPDELERTCGQLEIDTGSATWAIDFVRHCIETTYKEVVRHVGENDYDRVVLRVVSYIEKGAMRGRSQSEIRRDCRTFKALEPQVQDRVMESVRRGGDARLVAFDTATKPRKAWVHRNFLPDGLPEDDE